MIFYIFDGLLEFRLCLQARPILYVLVDLTHLTSITSKSEGIIELLIQILF